MALTEDAKTEIAKAVRIVREDKFEQYARTVLKPKEKEEIKPEDKGTEIEKKEGEEAPPPPEKEKEVTEEVTKRVDRWWGEIED